MCVFCHKEIEGAKDIDLPWHVECLMKRMQSKSVGTVDDSEMSLKVKRDDNEN